MNLEQVMNTIILFYIFSSLNDSYQWLFLGFEGTLVCSHHCRPVCSTRLEKLIFAPMLFVSIHKVVKASYHKQDVAKSREATYCFRIDQVLLNLTEFSVVVLSKQ